MSLESAPTLAITSFATIGLGLVVLILGYIYAKKKDFKLHRYLMIGAVSVNAAFLLQYIARYILIGNTEFPGPNNIRNFVYYPILIVHISFAIITIILIILHLKRTINHQKFTNQQVPYFDKEYRPDHRSFGRKVFYIWLFSYVGGITIFLMLYIIPYG